MNNNEFLVKKILETVDAGLSKGLGKPIPGKMCVEAAVCYAMGLEHSDKPPHTGEDVRKFKICLNDSQWSSNQARAAGLRKLAIAQLGSDGIDQREFTKNVSKRMIQIIIPNLFRRIAYQVQDRHQYAFLKAADRCETEGSGASAYAAAEIALDAAASSIISPVNFIQVASAANSGRVAISDVKATYAVGIATIAAGVTVAGHCPDAHLNMAAEIALQVLIEMKSPGCEYLYITEGNNNVKPFHHEKAVERHEVCTFHGRFCA